MDENNDTLLKKYRFWKIMTIISCIFIAILLKCNSTYVLVGKALSAWRITTAGLTLFALYSFLHALDLYRLL